jgi:hypothetical protein
MQVLTTFGSRGPEKRVALGKRPIRAYPQGLGQSCIDTHASHNVDSTQQSNQRIFSSPGPGLPSCGLRIAPLMSLFAFTYI